DAGVALADLLRGAEPLVGVRRRHPDIHDGHVRLVEADVAEEILGRPGRAGDLEPGLGQQPLDAFAQEERVVGEHYAHPASLLSDNRPNTLTRFGSAAQTDARAEPARPEGGAGERRLR